MKKGRCALILEVTLNEVESKDHRHRSECALIFWLIFLAITQKSYKTFRRFVGFSQQYFSKSQHVIFLAHKPYKGFFKEDI
jgi:hypothetical protein